MNRTLQIIQRNPAVIYPAGPDDAQAGVAALGGRAVPTTAIVVETLEPEWMVEIEVTAAP